MHTSLINPIYHYVMFTFLIHFPTFHNIKLWQNSRGGGGSKSGGSPLYVQNGHVVLKRDALPILHVSTCVA